MPSTSRKKVGVIDIGSNSVRLVIYAPPVRAMLPMFNEKVLCGLGRDLHRTGKLRPKGVGQALDTLKRFVALAEKMNVDPLHCVATAAVRDAKDGLEFVASVQQTCGLEISVLSGADEAQFSAHGVLAGIPAADGLVGDLGGGSLELVSVRDSKAGNMSTLPLGPQRLPTSGNASVRKEYVDEQLNRLEWLRALKGKDLLAVGGAWRAIARVHMAQNQYPLQVIHQYTIGRHDAESICQVLSDQSAESLRELKSASRQRLETLPSAAFVMHRLLRLVKPSRVVFCAHGLREGLLFDRLPKSSQNEDPLAVAYYDMEKRESRFPGFGAELSEWTTPLFPDESVMQARLRRASCYLSDVAWRVHSDYRHGQAFRRIIRAPFAAIDHPGRAQIALSVYSRYFGSPEGRAARSAREILDEKAIDRSHVLGLAMRLGYAIAGGTPGLLTDSRLIMDKRSIVLSISPSAERLRGGALNRRFESLAKVLGKKADFAISS